MVKGKEEVLVRSKEKKYRGKELDYLKTLTLKEFAEYLPARDRRSVLRHPEIIERFVKLCEEKVPKRKKIRTHLRDLVIVPKLVGMTIGIHNGKSFGDVIITMEMLGHRLGEFALTREKVTHSSAGIGATKSSRAAKK